MSTEQHLTPEQARQQLEAGRARPLASARDRRVHAVATAVFGVSVAALMAPQNVVSGAGRIALDVVYLVVALGSIVWVERAARTVPRRARLWSRVGVGASFLLALLVVLPFLNLEAQTEPNTWPMVIGAALVIAAPSLVAAAVIAGGRR